MYTTRYLSSGIDKLTAVEHGSIQLSAPQFFLLVRTWSDNELIMALQGRFLTLWEKTHAILQEGYCTVREQRSVFVPSQIVLAHSMTTSH